MVDCIPKPWAETNLAFPKLLLSGICHSNTKSNQCSHHLQLWTPSKPSLVHFLARWSTSLSLGKGAVSYIQISSCLNFMRSLLGRSDALTRKHSFIHKKGIKILFKIWERSHNEFSWYQESYLGNGGVAFEGLSALPSSFYTWGTGES